MAGPKVHVQGVYMPETGIPTGNVMVYPYGDIGVLQDVAYYTTLGLLYSVEAFDATLADGATIDIVITGPTVSNPPVSGEVYGLTIAAEAAMDGDGLMQLYSGATYTESSGTSLTPDQRNDNSPNTAESVVEQDPTVTDPGTLRDTYLITGGGGGNAVGGNAVVGRRIFAPSDTALLRLTNQSGQARRALLRTTWIEAPIR